MKLTEFYKEGVEGSLTWIILVIKLVLQLGKKNLINSTEITYACIWISFCLLHNLCYHIWLQMWRYGKALVLS